MAAAFLLFTIMSVYTPIGAMDENEKKKTESNTEFWYTINDNTRVRYKMDESYTFTHPLYITKVTLFGASVLSDTELFKQLLDKIGEEPNLPELVDESKKETVA